MEVFMYEQIYKKIEEECTFRNLSKGTEKQYIYHASCLLKWLGDKPVDAEKALGLRRIKGL